MPKKTRPKQKNGIDKILDKFTAIFEKKPIFSFTALTVLLMVGVFMLEQGASWFKASILDVPTFDGTVMPVETIPNWYKTGGSNDMLFSTYDSSELINIPKYDIDQLQSTNTDIDTINAQMTYSVVYMGNYEYDHTENAGSHLAVDIRMPEGTPVYAVANGIVTKAVSQNTGFGYHICIKHADVPVGDDTETLYSCYAHLNSVLVSEGQTVSKGTKIGLSGKTGTATTPHLHFQIDREDAPWHPWWPFSSAEASSAGLDFFSAINAGLGQSEAMKNTINPMEWVQAHLNYSGGSNANGTTENNNSNNTEENQKLSSLLIESNKSEVKSGETITLTITALDEDGDKMNNVNNSDINFTSTDKTITMPSLSFSSGVATAKITTNNTGSITFIVRTSTITSSTKVTITSDEENTENIDNSNNNTDNSNTEDAINNNAPSSYSLSAESFVKLADSTTITITALDENGDKMTGNFSLSDDLKLEMEGVGKLSEASLNGNDFNKGKATVIFTGVQTGTVTISLGSEKIEITTVEENMPVSSFEIEGPEEFTINQSGKITIYALDEDGQKTPSTFSGTAEITLTSGNGYFSQDELTRDDFKEGKAEVYFTAISTEDVKIKVKSGVLIGFSKNIGVEQLGQTFSDVDENNRYYLAINSLYTEGIINGFSDNTFRPTKPVNRAESLKMLLLALNVPITNGTVSFSDVDNSAWYVSYLYTGVKESIINGFADGTFQAANNVNRAEFFKILLAGADVDLESVNYAPFDDVNANDWYASYAKYARDNDLLDFSNGEFEPAKAMSRGEVAEAIYRFEQL